MAKLKSDEIPIAGKKTPRDWHVFRESLVVSEDTNIWKDAFEEYFLTRLSLRYVNPIRILDEAGHHKGEGFAILTIICSLIEFLESTIQGTNYRFERAEGKYEYSSSKGLFIYFLCNRYPFSREFDSDLAMRFYEGVRCGLLHEARLKDGWSLAANGPADVLVNREELVIYRINFVNSAFRLPQTTTTE